MRFLHLTIIRLSLCFLIGITLGFALSVDQWTIRLALGVVLFVFILSFFLSSKSDISKVIFWVFSHLLLFCIGFQVAVWNKMDHQPDHYIHHIKGEHHSIRASIQNDYKDTDYYQKYLLSIHQMDDKEVAGKALLQIPKKYAFDALTIGDHLMFNAKFQKFREAQNPQLFDYPEYMAHQDIHRYINLDKDQQLLIEHDDGFHILRFAEELRQKIGTSLIDAGFEIHQVNLIKALILGQKQDLDRSTYQKFADAGIVHILAVSGLHVGIVLVILQYVFSFFELIRYGKFIKLFFVLCFLWSFALMAGFSPSVVRASLMFTLFAIGFNLLKRRSDTLNYLAVSMILILVFYPKMIYQVGFQLSYTAVFGIVMMYPNLVKLYKAKYKVDQFIWSVICVTISAQLAILPLALYYFHQFPGLFIIANVLVIPFLGIILSAGFIAIGLSLLEMIPALLVKVIGWILDGLLYVTDSVAQYDQFLIKYIYFDDIMLVLSSMALFLFLIYQRSFQKRLLLISGCFVAVLLLYYHRVQPDRFPQKAFVFHQIAQSQLGFAQDQTLHIFTNDSSLTKSDYLIRNMQMKYGKKQVEIDSLENFYRLKKDKKLVIIDESGIYEKDWVKDNIVLLRNSPKINFDRLLHYQPDKIIADGSNYTSFVERWKVSAKEQNAEFYSTAEDGYWEYSIKNQ